MGDAPLNLDLTLLDLDLTLLDLDLGCAPLMDLDLDITQLYLRITCNHSCAPLVSFVTFDLLINYVGTSVEISWQAALKPIQNKQKNKKQKTKNREDVGSECRFTLSK